MTTDRVPSGTHNLIIDSLRDASARCTCGRWAIVITTTSHDNDEEIRAEVCHEHALHLARARALATPHKGDPP
jgi:hypothetical protein